MTIVLLLVLLCPFYAHAEYLGVMSASLFDSDSTANPFGTVSPSAPGLAGLSALFGLSGFSVYPVHLVR